MPIREDLVAAVFEVLENSTKLVKFVIP